MALQTAVSQTMAAGFAGMKADAGYDDCRTFAQAEVSAEIPFGVMVCQGTTRTKGILPVDANSIPVGILVHSHDYVPTVELGSTGLKPKVAMAVMNKGRIWVYSEEAVNVNDIAYFRHTARAGNTQKGAFRKSADTATAIICKGVRFVQTIAAAGLVIVEVDMAAYYAVPT